MPAAKEIVRIAAIGDLHYSRTAPPGSLQPLFAQINEAADILVLCGDLTDYGLPEEARALRARDRQRLKIPDGGRPRQPRLRVRPAGRDRKILTDAGVTMLDGDTPRSTASASPASRASPAASGGARSARGARTSSSSSSTSRGRSAEARVGAGAAAHRAAHRRAALRADPGDRRRRAARDLSRSSAAAASRSRSRRYPVSAVFHGHAHHGQPEGRTRNDVPVFNVSASLMRELFPERPFRLIDVDMTPADADAGRGAPSADRPIGRRTGADAQPSEGPMTPLPVLVIAALVAQAATPLRRRDSRRKPGTGGAGRRQPATAQHRRSRSAADAGDARSRRLLSRRDRRQAWARNTKKALEPYQKQAPATPARRGARHRLRDHRGGCRRAVRAGDPGRPRRAGEAASARLHVGARSARRAVPLDARAAAAAESGGAVRRRRTDSGAERRAAALRQSRNRSRARGARRAAKERAHARRDHRTPRTAGAETAQYRRRCGPTSSVTVSRPPRR